MTAVTVTPPNLGDSFGKMVKLALHNECRYCGKVSDSEIELDEFAATLMLGCTSGKAACPECAARIKEEENSKLAAARLEEYLRTSGIESEFLGTWDSNKGNCNLANAIRNNADKHLFIVGEYNTGKTRCACVNLERQIKLGKKGKCYQFSKLAYQYSQMFAKGETSPDDFVKRLVNTADIVVIDDLCKRKVTQTAAEFLYDLLDTIYSSTPRCRLWITSNIMPKHLDKKFESLDLVSAVASRIDRLHDAGKLKLVKADGEVL